MRAALASFLDASSLGDAFVRGVMLNAPVYTTAALLLFSYTGMPIFLLHACVGAVGNVVLFRHLSEAA